MSKPLKIIFFGNGPLAIAAKSFLQSKPQLEILYHATKKSDLETVKSLKLTHPEAFGILASFGVILKPEILNLFEPLGILNLHPSLLPLYRGPSPIESAILNGDQTFSVSIMKIVAAMDAGPIYKTATITPEPNFTKAGLYQTLGQLGAKLILETLLSPTTPTPQDHTQATYTKKLDPSLSPLQPEIKSANQLHHQVIAFQNYPKSRFTFSGIDCIILDTSVSKTPASPLNLLCKDKSYLNILRLQPASKKPMDAKSFLNGYQK